MKTLYIAALCISQLLFTAAASALTPDQLTSMWDGFAQKHVKAQGVDYVGVERDIAQLKAFLAGHEDLDIARADDLTKKAVYINLYNGLMMYNILRHAKAEKIAVTSPAFLSLKINKIDVPGGNIWNGDYKVNLAGQMVNLDNIEHQLIRGQDLPKKLKRLAVKRLDPRIHAAVNCAAKSCPPVRQRAYTPATADKMLTENMHTFLTSNGQFSKAGKSKLRANSILQWYYSDFDDWAQKNGMKGAGEYLAGFVAPNSKDAGFKKKHLKETFNDRSKWSLKVSSSYDWHYDWIINDVRNFK